MKSVSKVFVCLLFFPLSLRASGMPVIDTNELMKQVNDALYLLTSIENLLGEVSGDSGSIQTIISLQQEISRYQRTIRDYEALSGAIEDANYYDSGRSKVLSDQINSVTRHIRKLKSIVTLATTLGARPEAMNASLQVLRDEREREREKFNVAFKAIEERERVRELRLKITKKTRLKRSLMAEMDEINNITQEKSIRPVGLTQNKKQMGGLW